MHVQLLLIISCQKFGLIIIKACPENREMRIYLFKKYEFSPVHIMSPIAVSKSFPYNLG